MEYQHKNLASGKWFDLSLPEQLGNIGSEVGRATHTKGDQKRFWGATSRAFELLDLTIADTRWSSRLKELMRVREVLADAVLGGKEYGSTLEDLDRYFYYFAFAARAGR